METKINCKELFDPGAHIKLSDLFLESKTYVGSWQQKCIEEYKQKGYLKVIDAWNEFVKIQLDSGNIIILLYCDIKLPSLEKYRNRPDILKAFADNQARQGGLRNICKTLTSAFTWNESKEGSDFWRQINNGTFSPKEQETIKNNENHEIRLQKSKASIRRGTRPEGSRIRSTEHKIAIRSRQISYTACHC